MKLWALVGLAALGWWYYAGPIRVAKQIRSAAAEPIEADSSSLISSRVDFARVNAQWPDALNARSFSHLLFHGWLPQQRRNAPQGALARAQQTRMTVVRYQGLNRFIAIFWDANQVYQVVLTLQRQSAFGRWQVTQVGQFSECDFDFDCPRVRY